MLDTRPLHKKTLRFINVLGKFLMRLRLPIATLDEDMLHQSAIKSTGLDDFGDPHYLEGLRHLIASAHEVDFNFIGRMGFETMLAMNLRNRLLLIEKHKQNPEIFNRPLLPPIFIIGLPRSGSTLLHRMMALDPALRAPELWEVMRPIPESTPDQRYEQAVREINLGLYLFSNRDHIHYSRAFTPEECVLLLGPTFFSQIFWTYSPVYRYIEWYMQQDRTAPYREYKWYLQILQAVAPERRLLVKAPAHTGALDQILKFFPNALIIQTHRHPVKVSNSINSLNTSMHIRVTDRYDVFKTAEYTTHLWLQEALRNIKTRQLHPDAVYDIFYREFIADPIGVIRKIYTHFNLPWPERFEETLQAYLLENPQGKHGDHLYSSGQFGTTDRTIYEKFEAYCLTFGYTMENIV